MLLYSGLLAVLLTYCVLCCSDIELNTFFFEKEDKRTDVGWNKSSIICCYIHEKNEEILNSLAIDALYPKLQSYWAYN